MFTLVIDSNKYTINDELENIEEKLNEKYIEFDLTKSVNSYKIFFTRYFWSTSYMINCIFIPEYNVSLYNCYFSLNQNIVSLKFDTAVVGINSSNFDKEKTNQIYAKII